MFNAGGECYVKTDIHFPVVRNNYTFNPNSNYAQTHSRDFHPFVAFSEFIQPLTNHGFTITLGVDKLELYFGQPYDEEKNQFQYLKEVKVLKNVDTHLSFYVDQIQDFLRNYVIPYFENYEDTGDYGIPKNLKIPIMKIKTRKESLNQQMLDLHEKTFAKSFFSKYGL